MATGMHTRARSSSSAAAAAERSASSWRSAAISSAAARARSAARAASAESSRSRSAAARSPSSSSRASANSLRAPTGMLFLVPDAGVLRPQDRESGLPAASSPLAAEDYPEEAECTAEGSGGKGVSVLQRTSRTGRAPAPGE